MQKAPLWIMALSLFWIVGAGTALAGDYHAVDVLSCNDTTNLGNDYAVGWDFTVTQTITVDSLGQFDPDGTPVTNQVALYYSN